MNYLNQVLEEFQIGKWSNIDKLIYKITKYASENKLRMLSITYVPSNYNHTAIVLFERIVLK